MELVFVYIAEHKILNKISFITHPLFNVEFINNKIKITNKNDKIIQYYNGVKIKAIIGKNGCGKSTFLEFIEESFNYTESSGFMIWFKRDDKNFLIQSVNYDTGSLHFDFCHPHSISTLDKKHLKKYKHNIVKINNLSTFLPYVKSKKNNSIIDLSLSKQNSLTGNTRNTNLRNLITFFNESSWLYNKNANYRYNFKFKTPSNVIRNWIFSLYKKENPDVKEHLLKYKFNDWYDYFFGNNKSISGNLATHYSIFQHLIERNIFSCIRYISSTSLVDNEFSDKLASKIIHHILTENHIHPNHFIYLLDNVYTEWEGKRENKSNITKFDADILKSNISHIFMIFDKISHVIHNYLSTTSTVIVSDGLIINDPEVILHLLELIAKLPKNINNNFSYGWVGFSTGELAKLNIFSSIYNYIQNKKTESTLFILDETDLYLHPEWQRTFISELISFLENETDTNKIQLLITTHSPLIIGDFLPDDIISLQLDSNNKPYQSESYGFGTEITDAYISGMHISSTFGEHSRNKILELIDNKKENRLTESDHWLISNLKDSSIKRMLTK